MKMNFLLWIIDKYTDLMEQHPLLRHLFILLFTGGLILVMFNLLYDDKSLTSFKNRDQETIVYHPDISEIIVRDTRLTDPDRSFSIIPPKTVVVKVNLNKYTDKKNHVLIIEILD